MKTYRVAVVGATGAVGQQLINLLEEETAFQIAELRPLASKRSAGKTITFRGQSLTIQETTKEAFEGIDFAFFSAGGSISKQFSQSAVDAGAIVIDNTSAFRMDEQVPLVVPEVNAHALKNHQGIIANPNCSTIQMVVALEPIRQAFGLKRVIVSTYQAVSGAGIEAIDEMFAQSKAMMAGEPVTCEILPSAGDRKHYPIAFNPIPQIDLFGQDDYTLEELKMINETKKIMEDPVLQVAATCVRVPAVTGHCESVYLEVEQDGVTVEDLKAVLAKAPGLVLQDKPSEQVYPMAITSVGKKETFIGRLRRDLDNTRGFHSWIVSDNLLKGAAWNSVQIAETMVEMNLI